MKLDTNKALKSVKYNNVDVPLASGLNIAYGLTPPADTSKLWVRMEGKPDFVEVSTSSLQSAIDTISKALVETPDANVSPSAAYLNGKIFIFTSNTNSGKVSAYDIETDTLEILPQSLKRPYFYDGAAVTWNGAIYLLSSSYSDYKGKVYKYDETSNTITFVGNMSVATYMFSYALYGSVVYMLGGYDVTAIQAYDLETNVATTVGSMDESMYGGAGALVNGVIYVLGGMLKRFGRAASSIYAYDITTNVFTTTPQKLGKQTYWNSAAAVNNKVYSFGGTDGGSSSASDYNTITEYDPLTGVVSVKDSVLPNKIVRSTAVEVDGTVYIIGSGTATGDSGRNIYIYTPKALLLNNRLKLFATNHANKSTQPVTSIVSTKDALIDLFFSSAYIGDAQGYAKKQLAYVYDDVQQSWVSLDGAPYTA